MAKKKITAPVYTKGKYGREFRVTADTDNPFLYSMGRYPTKITKEDLPDDYIEIHSRVIWYMTGYLRTSGIVDLLYRPLRMNHMFKDDCLYISYRDKITVEKDSYGFNDYKGCDVFITGGDIVNIVLAAEKFSLYDTREIRRQIEEKRIWFRDNQKDLYELEVGYDENIFTHWEKSVYFPEKLRKQPSQTVSSTGAPSLK